MDPDTFWHAVVAITCFCICFVGVVVLATFHP